MGRSISEVKDDRRCHPRQQLAHQSRTARHSLQTGAAARAGFSCQRARSGQDPSKSLSRRDAPADILGCHHTGHRHRDKPDADGPVYPFRRAAFSKGQRISGLRADHGPGRGDDPGRGRYGGDSPDIHACPIPGYQLGRCLCPGPAGTDSDRRVHG